MFILGVYRVSREHVVHWTWDTVTCTYFLIYLLTYLLGRLFRRVDLLEPVSNVRLRMRMYIHVCIHPLTKSSFDFSEIWHVGRGRWVMHDGMQYDPIQGQGHEPLKGGNPFIFKSCLLRHLQWELSTDHGFLN